MAIGHSLGQLHQQKPQASRFLFWVIFLLRSFWSWAHLHYWALGKECFYGLFSHGKFNLDIILNQIFCPKWYRIFKKLIFSWVGYYIGSFFVQSSRRMSKCLFICWSNRDTAKVNLKLTANLEIGRIMPHSAEQCYTQGCTKYFCLVSKVISQKICLTKCAIVFIKKLHSICFCSAPACWFCILKW